MRTLLGLVVGTNVQAYDADLAYLAGFTPSANVKTILNAADYSAIRTALGLIPGTSATNIVQLDASAKLPAIDGSQLTNLPVPGGALKADGTVTLSGDWNAGNYVITAKGFVASKVSGTPGKYFLYEANSTDLDGAGTIGPASVTANTSWMGQYPNARPGSGTRNTLVWDSTSTSGDGTPATPYIHPMSYLDLDATYLALAGGTMTGKLNLPAATVSANPLNIGQGTCKTTGTNGDLCMTAAGVYAWYNGSYSLLASGSPAFSVITGGTNTNALVIGNSGSLSATGTGIITATALSAQYLDWSAASGPTSIANKPGTSTDFGATGARIQKGWFANLEITNLPTVNGGTLASALSLGTMAAETATSYVTKALYDANTILYATNDNTPAALTVGASTIVGRKASGDIVALTGAEALAITEGLSATSPGSLNGSTEITLTAAQMSDPRCEVGNWGQTDDIPVNLPAAGDGLACLFNVGKTVSGKMWGVCPNGSEVINLVAAAGTVMALTGGHCVIMTEAQKGQSFAIKSVKTGANTYEWWAKAIAVGTSTFADHAAY